MSEQKIHGAGGREAMTTADDVELRLRFLWRVYQNALCEVGRIDEPQRWDDLPADKRKRVVAAWAALETALTS